MKQRGAALTRLREGGLHLELASFKVQTAQ